MKIYRNLPEKNIVSKSAVSIGSFDGIHLGHQKIISYLKNFSRNEAESVLITFHPTPQHFFLKEKFKGYLSSKNEKINLIKKLGIDNLCIIEFDNSIKDLSAQDFLNKIVKAFSPKTFIVGYNHSFGKDRIGNIDFLDSNRERYSFKTIRIDEVTNAEMKISSSDIRDFLQSGEIRKANIALGNLYSLCGLVVAGKGLGKKIGFPTANIAIKEDKLTPANGVYFIEATVNQKKFKGMCNIGFNPTIGNNKDISIEAHLFNLDKDIYDKEIIISFIDFVRKERKFKDVNSLKKQLEIDKNKCLEYSLYNV